jgi:hypothetical protein
MEGYRPSIDPHRTFELLAFLYPISVHMFIRLNEHDGVAQVSRNRSFPYAQI